MSRHLAAFFAVTFAISWAIWGFMIAGSVSIETTTGLILNIIATAGPSIAALAIAIALDADTLARLLEGFSLGRVSPRWARDPLRRARHRHPG